MEGTEFRAYCPFTGFTQGQNTKNKIESGISALVSRGKRDQERRRGAGKKGKHMKGGPITQLATPLEHDRDAQREHTNYSSLRLSVCL